MLVDLVCPVCLHDAGRVEFDNTARGACPGCNLALKIETNILPAEGFFEPPPRQLALRVERPRRSTMKLRQDGDLLVIWQRTWLFFVKRIELSPEGYIVRVRKQALTRMLPELRGFLMLQRCVDMRMSPIFLTWISHEVWQDTDGIDRYVPLYAHNSYEEGAYCCSQLNAHLATLRRRADPYRGQLPAPE